MYVNVEDDEGNVGLLGGTIEGAVCSPAPRQPDPQHSNVTVVSTPPLNHPPLHRERKRQLPRPVLSPAIARAMDYPTKMNYTFCSLL